MSLDDLIGRLVLVVWNDASFLFDLNDPAEMSEDHLMETYGIVCRVTDDNIYVAGEKDDNGYRAVSRVPWAIVRDVRGLTVGEADLTEETPEPTAELLPCGVPGCSAHPGARTTTRLLYDADGKLLA